MIGTTDRPYKGRIEHWDDVNDGINWLLSGFIYDNPDGLDPGKPFRTGGVIKLNRITNECVTKMATYKLGKPKVK